MAQGFVYLIENTFDGKYKIGYTEGTVEERRKQLSTGSSQPLSIVYAFQTKYPRKLESYMHKVFKHKHHLGEWFSLEPEQISMFFQTCVRMEKSYDFLFEQKNNFIKE